MLYCSFTSRLLLLVIALINQFDHGFAEQRLYNALLEFGKCHVAMPHEHVHVGPHSWYKYTTAHIYKLQKLSLSTILHIVRLISYRRITF